MDKIKQWVALTVVGVLAVMAAGWFLLVSPKRAEAADIRLDVEQAESEARQLRTQLTMLKEQAKTLPQVQARLAAVAAKIPDNPALPALIRALTKAADDAGVELVSLSPGTPTAVTAAVPAARVTPKAAGATGTTGSTAKSTTGAGAPSVTAVAGTVGAAAAGTLTTIPLTVNVVGGYFQVEQFFDRVESLSRAMKVTAFTMAVGENPLKKSAVGGQPDGRTLVANLTASVYMAAGRVVTVPAAPVAGK